MGEEGGSSGGGGRVHVGVAGPHSTASCWTVPAQAQGVGPCVRGTASGGRGEGRSSHSAQAAALFGGRLALCALSALNKAAASTVCFNLPPPSPDP